jgi:hypothetical protein
MRALVVSLPLLLLTTTALADGEIKLEVQLGKKVTQDVGYARGWMCDDPSLVQAELVTKNDKNYWVVTGAKLGTTLCRVGTQPLTPVYYVFEVHVVPAKKR